MLRFEGYRGIDWAELCNWRGNSHLLSRQPSCRGKIDARFAVDISGVISHEKPTPTGMDEQDVAGSLAAQVEQG